MARRVEQSSRQIPVRSQGITPSSVHPWLAACHVLVRRPLWAEQPFQVYCEMTWTHGSVPYGGFTRIWSACATGLTPRKLFGHLHAMASSDVILPSQATRAIAASAQRVLIVDPADPLNKVLAICLCTLLLMQYAISDADNLAIKNVRNGLPINTRMTDGSGVFVPWCLAHVTVLSDHQVGHLRSSRAICRAPATRSGIRGFTPAELPMAWPSSSARTSPSATAMATVLLRSFCGERTVV